MDGRGVGGCGLNLPPPVMGLPLPSMPYDVARQMELSLPDALMGPGMEEINMLYRETAEFYLQVCEGSSLVPGIGPVHVAAAAANTASGCGGEWGTGGTGGSSANMSLSSVDACVREGEGEGDTSGNTSASGDGGEHPAAAATPPAAATGSGSSGKRKQKRNKARSRSGGAPSPSSSPSSPPLTGGPGGREAGHKDYGVDRSKTGGRSDAEAVEGGASALSVDPAAADVCVGDVAALANLALMYSASGAGLSEGQSPSLWDSVMRAADTAAARGRQQAVRRGQPRPCGTRDVGGDWDANVCGGRLPAARDFLPNVQRAPMCGGSGGGLCPPARTCVWGCGCDCDCGCTRGERRRRSTRWDPL